MRTHEFMVGDKVLCLENCYSIYNQKIQYFTKGKIYKTREYISCWVRVIEDDIGQENGWGSENFKNLYNLSQDEIDQLIKDLNNQYGGTIQYHPPNQSPYSISNDKWKPKDDQLSFGLNSPEPKKIVCECGAEKTHGNNSGHSSWCPKAGK